MITEDDIVANCRLIVTGEKEKIQNNIRRTKKLNGKVSTQELDGITFKARFYLRALHNEADQLIDSWVAEALQ